ncbi:hypothetical protein BGZ99_008120 [Dissophora globulifera]|uniref:Uncharacterized protein n=1 Tax=Dissophora globulifera TaxID=979702 RepID=A0A9P6RC40_9FUNG|nr:hypothetical protein BGZ99_008120 [Dissophora globulifera]
MSQSNLRRTSRIVQLLAIASVIFFVLLTSPSVESAPVPGGNQAVYTKPIADIEIRAYPASRLLGARRELPEIQDGRAHVLLTASELKVPTEGISVIDPKPSNGQGFLSLAGNVIGILGDRPHVPPAALEFKVPTEHVSVAGRKPGFHNVGFNGQPHLSPRNTEGEVSAGQRLTTKFKRVFGFNGLGGGHVGTQGTTSPRRYF